MPLPSLTINGFDLESYGFRIETIDGPWDLPETTDPTLVVPGRSGTVRTGAPTTVAPRTITITGKIVKDAALLAKLDTIKALFALGILELTFANQPTRVYQTRPQSLKVEMIGGAIVATSAQISVSLQCADPIAYNLEPTCVTFAAGRVACPVGTAPSIGHVLRFIAPFTNTTVTIRAASGEIAHSLGVTRAGTADLDYEEIDVDAMKAARSQSASVSNDANAITSGDIESFAISPEDGDPTLGIGPTAEASGISGDGVVMLTYYMGWI